MHTQINPVGKMNLLSQAEVDHLQQSATSELYNLYRNCSLAVLNAGSHTDNAEDIYQQFQDFHIQVLRRERGVKLALDNPPEHAFVDAFKSIFLQFYATFCLLVIVTQPILKPRIAQRI